MTHNRVKILTGVLLALYSLLPLCAESDNLKTTVVEPVVIENPTPTHFEKKVPMEKLELVHNIPMDFSDDHFFAKPESLTVDEQGNLYVYDQILNKIMKFDDRFNFVKKWGNTGRGPGDFGTFDQGAKYIYYATDGLLYFSDFASRKLIIFNKDGKFLREHTLRFFDHSFRTVVGPAGELLLTSAGDGAVDVFDSQFKRNHFLLDKADYNRFLIRIPFLRENSKKRYLYNEVDSANTVHELTKHNLLVVYLYNSSTVYVFKGNKLKRHFDVWPEQALEQYRRSLKKLQAKLKGSTSFFRSMAAYDMLVDKDNGEYFYLNLGFSKEGAVRLYKFDLKGQLVSVIEVAKRTFVHAKRNNLYYAIGNDQIYIFKK